MLERVWRKWNALALLGGIQIDTATMEDRNYRNSFKNLGIKPPYDPAIPLLDIHPEETRVEKDTCITLFIATLFTIARTLPIDR